MQPSAWWRAIALGLVGLAACVIPAARAVVGPPGALVHVRWNASVEPAARRQLEGRFRLVDGRRLDEMTWRYDLIDPSPGNIQALVQNGAVEDTHNIDRSAYRLDAAATRTDRRQRMASGTAIVAAAEWAATMLAAGGALLLVLVWLDRVPNISSLRRHAQRAISLARSGLPLSDAAGRVTLVPERGARERPRLWTAAVAVAVAPSVVILCMTLWLTPLPITEVVALFEDAVEQPISRVLTPDAAYYRPLWNLTLSAFFHGAGSIASTAALVKLMTIVPVVLLVALLIWHVRPRTMLEAAAASLAVAVLIGSPGFRDNLEIGIYNTIVPMALALIAWVLMNTRRRVGQGPAVVLCVLLAIGFKEQGLILVPLVVAAWWAKAPGASHRLAATAVGIGVAYLVFRLTGSSGSWQPFQQDVGLGFSEIEMGDAAARFGAFPYWIYCYNAVSTIANVLLSEPTRGMFQVVHALIESRLQPWHIVHVASSLALTAIVIWWGIRCGKAMAAGQGSLEGRILVATIVVVLASGALGFNYSRDRLGGLAAIFYALAAFFALRAAGLRVIEAPRARMAAAALGLALLAAAWQSRVIGTLEYARVHSWGNQREWFIRLPQRRIEFAHRSVYIEIMDAMVSQGRDTDAPRPTRYPRWIQLVIGQPPL